MPADLPFVDEHRIAVRAPAAAVWQALAAEIVPFTDAGLFARLLGADPAQACGTPLTEGSTLPGFRVAEAVPERLARLTGGHRFSRYALVFSLTPQADATMLSARTYAAFPGPHGRAYRLLVIGSGGHRHLVKRLLRSVRRRGEGTPVH